jgi:hypothetical protein
MPHEKPVGLEWLYDQGDCPGIASLWPQAILILRPVAAIIIQIYPELESWYIIHLLSFITATSLIM